MDIGLHFATTIQRNDVRIQVILHFLFVYFLSCFTPRAAAAKLANFPAQELQYLRHIFFQKKAVNFRALLMITTH